MSSPTAEDLAWLDRNASSRPKGSSPPAAEGGMFDPARVASVEEELHQRKNDLDDLIADHEASQYAEAAAENAWEGHYHRYLARHGAEHKSADLRLAAACEERTGAVTGDGEPESGHDLLARFRAAKAVREAMDKAVKVRLAQVSAAQSLLRDIREHLG